MRPLPLSKPCDLNGDAPALASYFDQIDAVPEALDGQHPIRRWEYGMALLAIDRWRAAEALDRGLPEGTELPPFTAVDVGGAGSNWWTVLRTLGVATPVRVDPALAGESPQGVADYAMSVTELAALQAPPYDVVTCLSVIEHVPHLPPFLRACHRLLRPGGLLVLTTDYWDAEGDDVAHFHWMRERIYNADRIRRLITQLREGGFRVWGLTDWRYPGNQLYDYSVASLVVRKGGEAG